MIDYDAACSLIAEQIADQRTEVLPLAEAGGRFLASRVDLVRDQPSFDRATMDGYAVHLVTGQDRYPVIGSIHAGEVSDLAPAAGQAVRIMTGAPCPPACCVVPIEATDGGEREVRLLEADKWRTGLNIAPRGEDGRSGETVVRPGTRLTAAVLAVTAMAGVEEVTVFQAPTVGICTTGDELGGDDAAAISDSNGPLLLALLGALGLPTSRRHARDEAASLRQSLAELQDGCEIIVTTGGASAGDRDLVPAIFAELGFKPLFHGVMVQPGKPVYVARDARGRFAVGLPGNPVSVLATAHLFLLPVIGRFLRGWWPTTHYLPLACDFHHRKRRRLFLPAQLVDGGLQPMAWHGSGDLIAAAAADGLIDLQPGATYAAGDLVGFLPYVGGPLGERAGLPDSRD